MQLEALSAEIRPRSNWEAMDLGLALLRREAGKVYGAWFAITLPAILVLLGLSFWLESTWPLFIFWWLKPVFDRIVLHVLGHGLFGTAPTVRETLHAAPSFMSGWLFSALLLRRLDLGRTFNLPVYQLEGLRAGPALRQRLGVLNRRARGSAIAAAVVCMHIVTGLQLAVLGLIASLVPPEWVDFKEFSAWLLSSPSITASLLLYAAYYVAESIVEPLFVAAGFGLYLGRRTQLEAWDLELAFRRLAARLSRGSALAATLGLFLLLALSALPQAAYADSEDAPTITTDHDSEEVAPGSDDIAYWRQRLASSGQFAAPKLRDMATEVEQDPLFGYRADGWKVKPRRETKPEPKEVPGWLAWIGKLGTGAALVVEILMWAALALLAYFLGRYLWRQRARWGVADDPLRSPVAAVQFEAVGEDGQSLPNDVAGAARRALAAGELAAALSLLYRGSLARLAGRGIIFPNGATEGECLQRVRAEAPSALVADFERLVALWQMAAYGKRVPEPDLVAAACAQWLQHYGAAVDQ